jgi:hypothetical protein
MGHQTISSWFIYRSFLLTFLSSNCWRSNSELILMVSLLVWLWSFCAQWLDVRMHFSQGFYTSIKFKKDCIHFLVQISLCLKGTKIVNCDSSQNQNKQPLNTQKHGIWRWKSRSWLVKCTRVKPFNGTPNHLLLIHISSIFANIFVFKLLKIQ